MSHDVTIDGRSLTLDAVAAVARHSGRVSIAPEVAARLERSRAVVERAAAADLPTYGINTGFGVLASVRIPSNQLDGLQRNLVLSHASGMGTPLPEEIVRAIMLLRANTLVRETSGVRIDVPDRLVGMINHRIHPVIPEQGSVGASGDLAPLAHVALALIGEGSVTTEDGRVTTAAAALAGAGLEPVTLRAKEGLALANGTQAQTAILALTVRDARALWRTAHGAAAMSLEALKGTPDPFDARLHAARGHPGQEASAALLRELLGAESAIRESHRTNDDRVQDAYSVRCTPQVLGAVRDGIDFAERVVVAELNAATDNPLVLGDDIVSGGNFHGQPVAFALDCLTIALTTLVGISERRIERLVNPDLSPGLPAFLATTPGLESGLMMVQVAAAAVTAECRTLSTPASVQSIPTNANQEDVVPMGMLAAWQARRVLENAQRVVACELLSAAEGLEYHRPLSSTPAIEALHGRVRSLVPPLTGDRSLTADLERLTVAVAKESWI